MRAEFDGGNDDDDEAALMDVFLRRDSGSVMLPRLECGAKRSFVEEEKVRLVAGEVEMNWRGVDIVYDRLWN